MLTRRGMFGLIGASLAAPAIVRASSLMKLPPRPRVVGISEQVLADYYAGRTPQILIDCAAALEAQKAQALIDIEAALKDYWDNYRFVPTHVIGTLVVRGRRFDFRSKRPT